MPSSPSAWYTTRRGRIRVEAAVAAGGLFLIVGPITVAFKLDAPGIVVAPLSIVALLALGLGMLALYVEVLIPVNGGRLDRSGEFVPHVRVSDLAALHEKDPELFHEYVHWAGAFQEEDENERAVARLVSGNGPPPLHWLGHDVADAAEAPPEEAPPVPIPPRPGGIAERWYWLTYDVDEDRRLPLLWALDGPALAFDRMLAGERADPHWRAHGPMAPPPEPISVGRALHARAVGEMRRILCGDDPRDAEEALLTWLVRDADLASTRLMGILFETSRERLQARRRLRRMFPGISANASHDHAGELIALHHRSRPAGDGV